MKHIIQSTNLEKTLALGQTIGTHLHGGETIELASDLGGGKTALTKGIAAGMGSEDTVQSPTFTISRIYQGANKLELHHFDFYRLEEPGIMAAELAEVVGDPELVVVIEWSGIVSEILPGARIRIAIVVTGEHSRQFTIEVPDAYRELNSTLRQFTEENT
jgi:tRNA threonylcarbamoyladenosine biosynthesis protein TsaE